MQTFVGQRKPLDSWDIPELAYRLKTTEDELRAFLEVEARSRGYDREGRPIMLFEPHVFYRNLHDEDEKARAVKAGVAYRRWGEKPYPKDSYPRLKVAIEINEDAALKAASIGLSQVLVENHASVGYQTPQDMWQAFMDDEQEHVEAMVRFILVNSIDDDLRAHRWEQVARIYNGPGYKKHNYHGRMAAAFRKFKGIEDVAWTPDSAQEGQGDLSDDQLRQVQKKLRELGYVEAGKADGKWGTKTRAAVLAFRADNDLPIKPSIDDEFLAAMVAAVPRGIGEARQNLTVEDVRKEGSRTVKAADAQQATGAVVAVGGGATAVVTAIEDAQGSVGALQGLLDSIEPMKETALAIGPYALVALGAFVIWQAMKSRNARVEDERSGIHAGRP